MQVDTHGILRRNSRLIRTLLGPLAALTLAPAVALGQNAHDHHQHHGGAAMPGSGYSRAAAQYEIPDVTLINGDGKQVSLRAELDSGSPAVVNFIFTSCTAICPVMSATFSQVERVLGADTNKPRIVSISIDPEYDTPARLKEYAMRHDAGPDWQLLTGRKETILSVARAFDAWRGDKMNHTPSTYLRAGPNKPWVRLDGFASPAEIVREYRTMLGTPLTANTR
jgi:protein SCO1/2